MPVSSGLKVARTMAARAVVCMLVCASAVAAQSSVVNFTCDALRSSVSTTNAPLLVPSWCAAVNPLILARSASFASGLSHTFTHAHTARLDDVAAPASYDCTPSGMCSAVDTFAADDFPCGDGPGGIASLLVLAAVTPGGTRSLALYTPTLEHIYTPISGYQGTLTTLKYIVDPTPGAYGVLVAYGGVADVNYSSPTNATCDTCISVSFLYMNTTSYAAIMNQTHDIFLPASGYGRGRTVLGDTAMFSAPLTDEDAQWLDARLGGLMRGKQTVLGVGALYSHALVLQHVLDPSAPDFGWSVVDFMFFSVSSNACAVYTPYPTWPCFLPIAQWMLQQDGAPVPPTANVRLRTATTFQECASPPQPLAYAYERFYSAQQCQTQVEIVTLAVDDEVAVFPYRLANATIDVSDPTIRLLRLRDITGPETVIGDLTLFSQVTLTQGQLDAIAQGESPVANATVWLAAATGANGISPPQVVVATVPQAAAGWIQSPQPCDWEQWWNGTSCEPVPYAVESVSSSAAGVVQLQAQWRQLPTWLSENLVIAGCSPFNMSCIAAFINATLSGVVAPKHAFAAAKPGLVPAMWKLWHAVAAATSSPATPETLAAVLMYGIRFQLFAALSEPQVSVLELLPDDTAGGLQLAVSLANILPLLGPLTNMLSTENAQYVFGAVARPSSTLAAMERSADICAALARNPSDPFLAPYTTTCNSSPAPRYPALEDFLQVASACIPGILCPSLSEEVLAALPAGYMSSFGFDVTPCPPDFLCTDGAQRPCPPGFSCANAGTILPQACPFDQSLSTTCYDSGVGKLTVCPNGTICGVPYLPPIPAPPGYAQNVTDSIRSLTPCVMGDWCGLGRAVADPSLACPAGAYCASSDVLEPTPCNLGGACNASACPLMPYCPASSTSEQLCPAGFYCLNNTYAEACASESVCAPGSPIWQLCPARFYCPSPGVQYQCPDGSYCPQGSVQPILCNPLSHCVCAGGCDQPPFSIVLAIGGMCAAVLVVTYVLWRYAGLRQLVYKAWQRSRDEAMLRRHQRAVALFPDAQESLLARDSQQTMRSSGSSRPLSFIPVRSMRLDALQVGSIPYSAAVREHVSVNGSEGSAGLDSGSTHTTVAVRSLPRVMTTERDFYIDIRCEQLGLRLRSNGAAVLADATCSLRHGRVTAVMGPSGAGKSTFLTALCGKAAYGEPQGRVYINSQLGTLTDARYKHLVGFVPQEDIMMRDLTVEENIAFSALTRLPAHWSVDRKLMYADAVIELLALDDIRDSVIGDEERRGISGGQRKRVNIGIEMAANPCVLFADEPTSGLDAVSAMQVCTALRRIADLGITVALVLHQPRHEIFFSFDDLLLLGKGGHTVYFGPVTDALPYVQRTLQVQPPEHVNLADFLLDVVSGQMPPAWAAAHPAWSPTDLFELWKVESLKTSAHDVHVSLPLAAPPHRPVAFFRLVLLFMLRSLSQQLRHPLTFLLNNGLTFISALFLAAVYFGDLSYGAPLPLVAFAGCPDAIARSSQLCLSESQDELVNRGVMTVIALSLTGAATFVPVFVSERVVYWREASVLQQPRHSIAYFCGKDLAMLVQILLGPAVFCFAYEALATPRASFTSYYLLFLGVYWCASGFAYVTSVLAPPALAQLLGVTVIFANAMFAGGQPSLPVMQQKFAPLRWMPTVSFMRYALEAEYVVEVQHYEDVVALQGIDLRAHVRDTFGYDLDAFSRNLVILLLIGVVLRVAAVAALHLSHRDRKK